MSERIYKLKENKRLAEENTKQIRFWKQNAVMSEVEIGTSEKLIGYQIKLHKDIVNKLKLKIERAIKNAKVSHKKIDDLLKEKEDLHIRLKLLNNYGKLSCEYCGKFYTRLGLPRHKSACSSKPEIKDAKKHKSEMSAERKILEAKREALQKQIADLGKK